MQDSKIEHDLLINIEKEKFDQHIERVIEPYINDFFSLLKSHLLFKTGFLLFLVAEVLYFIAHLVFFVQTFTMAIHLALIFTTLFSFFAFSIYFNSRKEEQFIELKNQFLKNTEAIIEYDFNQVQSYLTLAHITSEFSQKLKENEKNFFFLLKKRYFFSPLLEWFNHWLFWEDLFKIREMYLESAIQEYLKLIHLEPLNLDGHLGLANGYLMLSSLYSIYNNSDEELWSPKNKQQEILKKKFIIAIERAIEELNILKEYSPGDPWIHAQLALCYHDLKRPQDEIAEYQTLIQLFPDDKDIAFKLAKLYFEQGHNLKGLQLYASLKKANFIKAPALIKFYGPKEPISLIES